MDARTIGMDDFGREASAAKGNYTDLLQSRFNIENYKTTASHATFSSLISTGAIEVNDFSRNEMTR